MEAVLSQLVNLYVSTPGRRMFAFRETLALAQEAGWPELTTALEQAIAHERQVFELQRLWDRRNDKSATFKPLAIDNRIDQLLSALFSAVQAFATLEDPASATTRAALTLRDEVLPPSIYQMVTLTYPEQVAAVDELVTRLRGPFAAQTAALRLDELLGELAAQNDKLRQAISQEKPQSVSYDQLLAARALGQDNLLWIVALSLGRYARPAGEELAQRSRLLRPILKQDAAVGAYYRRRRAVPEVNPETGEASGAPSPEVI